MACLKIFLKIQKKIVKIKWIDIKASLAKAMVNGYSQFL